jgi:predicted metal-dependent hydrolase
MPTEALILELAGAKVPCALIRRPRKSLQLEVLPDMSVQLIAPPLVTVERCQDFLRRKRAWVSSQRKYFSTFHPLTKPRQFVAGETHLFLGRRLRLKVLRKGSRGVRATRTHLEICLGGSTDPRLVEAAVRRFYREQAAGIFEARMTGCLSKLGIEAGRGPKTLVIRYYKARWGGMSPKGVLSLNLDLIRAPLECLDYVIIHELCHIRVPNHGPRFWNLLETVLPDWRKRKDKLEHLTA